MKNVRRALLGAFFVACLASGQAKAQTNQTFGMAPCGTPQRIAASTTSANVQLSRCGSTAQITNIGSVEAFYSLGSSSATAATSNSYPIEPGQTIALSSEHAQLYVAAVTASGTSTITITQSNGIGNVSGVGGSGGGGTVNPVTPTGTLATPADVPVPVNVVTTISSAMSRRFLAVKNTGTGNCRVGYSGVTPSAILGDSLDGAAGAGRQGGSTTFGGSYVPTGTISAFCPTSASTFSVMEGQ